MFTSIQAASDTRVSFEPQVIGHASFASSLPRIYDVDISPEIFESVNQDLYKSYIQEFTSNGSRHIYLDIDIPGSVNEMSRYWLVDKMMELSNDRLEIEIIGDYKNVVGRLPGYLPSNDLPVFVISAHYDTVPLSPGANDDGSGIAAVLELIRIMSHYEWPLDIYFMAFNGNQALYDILIPKPGRLLGSPEVAEAFEDAGIEILALFDVTTILRQSTSAPPDEKLILAYNELGQASYHVSQYWADLGKTMSNWYGNTIVKTVSSELFSQWRRCDEWRFVQAGYDAAVLAFESGYSEDVTTHTPDDVWSRGEYSYATGREATALIGASIAYSMSKAYGDKHILFNRAVAYPDRSNLYYFPVTMATTINITARWYGASATFLLYSPTGSLLGTRLFTTGHPWDFTQIFSTSVTEKGLYLLETWDTGSDSLGIDAYFDYPVDTNGNGVSDQYEYWLSSSLFSVDSDSDSVSDAMEIIYGTDGTNPDSDNDSLPDNWEIENGLNPIDPSDASEDNDNDTLTNLQEFTYGLNPNSSDSDSDQLPDAWEIANGLDPLVNDADEDPDDDTYTNLQEYLRGTNPQIAESGTLALLLIAAPSSAIILLGVAVFVYRELRQ
ncbi:MAG: M28 family peptidase [Candidatus Thorarchaeota archaeon]|nr:M28 family peptidase [Candidatus Thorarchaeota archaeon]